ncbi:MAG: glucokinase [Betaproteobacteria bacterium]|nr:MAG: glucokinase [Betaproteobacteria bacterium]
MNLLVGDIGGTHTRLAIAEVGIGGRVRLSPVERLLNAAHADLTATLRDYLARHPRLTRACLAVAGPTDGKTCRLTNLGWQIDAADLGAELNLRMSLVNDFAAVGWGIGALSPEHTLTLQTGRSHADASLVVLGAGTGLGVAICAPGGKGKQHKPMPGEGGHIAFAPTDAEQDTLLAFLRNTLGRVSNERILSGPGLLALYRFQCNQHNQTPVLQDPAAISTAALAHSDTSAEAALHLFAQIYAQVAGDIALIAGAQSGVYLAGGIATQILPFLQTPSFVHAFISKGRFTPWMQAIPLHIVLDPDIGLKGAALAATET